MKTLVTLVLIAMSTLNSVLACDPDFTPFCQSSNGRFADMNMFAATIESIGEQHANLNVISVIRGEESRSVIRIWDGPEVRSDPDDDCDYYASGFASLYGAVGDTIFCTVDLIVEKQNDWEVIGDYRRPPTDPSYNASYVIVENGRTKGFDNLYPSTSAPVELFFEYGCSIVSGCTEPDACNYLPNAQVDNGSCYFDCEAPVVNCPVGDIYLCESTKIIPLELQDFEVTDNVTPSNELSFSALRISNTLNQYKILTLKYFFYDADRNLTNCEQRYFLPKETLLPPSINSTINICQNEEAVVLTKPFNDYFLFYKDNNGTIGEMVGKSDYGQVSCYGENFGINTANTGTYKFWASRELRESEIMEGTPYYSCESEPVQFTVNINPANKVVLKEETLSIKMGQYYNLMELVEENKNGYWRGQDVFSFSSVTGQNYFYFYPQKTGLHKVFYAVNNGDCSEMHTKVIEVQSLRLANDHHLSDPLIIFPNPTHDKAYINLSNSIDAEHYIEVYDINGKLHDKQTVNNVKNTLFELNLADAPKGIYLVEVRNQFGISSKRLLKE